MSATREARRALLEGADRGPLWRRLGWLLLIWALSVLALGAISWFLRLWLAQIFVGAA